MRGMTSRWPVHLRRWRLITSAALVACLLPAGGALAVGDANRADCSEFAGTEASPGFTDYLPDCRAFELVTPPYQGGSPALTSFFRPPAMSPDGRHLVAYNFAGGAGAENDEQAPNEYGAVYEFSRTSSGWSTESLEPTARLAARRRFLGTSADLSRSLWKLVVQPREGEEVPLPEAQAYNFAVREAVPGEPARFLDVGPADSPEGLNEAGVAGVSGDLTHILLAITGKANQLWPGDKTQEGDRSLYEYVGTGNHEPTLVGVRNAGPLEGAPHLNEHAELVSECGTILGSAGEASAYNAVSNDGTTVYFTALHGACSTPTVNELYARIDGAQTTAISEPAMTPQREAECSGLCREDESEQGGHVRSPALFEGASEDGSRVFFTTTQPLLNSDENASRDLYEAEVGPSGIKKLVQVSRGDGVKPAAANVVSVARISADGSRVYYVAKGILTTTPNSNGEIAENEAYNLYVYDLASGGTSFVAKLLTPEEEAILKKELEEGKGEGGEAIKETVSEVREKREAIQEKSAECKKEHEEGKLEEAKACKKELKELEGGLEEAELELSSALTEALARNVELRTRVAPRDEERPFETTPDGHFLAFASARDLTGGEDTSTVGQVFEYNAQTGALTRVSVGQCRGSGTGCVASERFNDNGGTTNPLYAARMLSPDYFGSLAATQAASALSLANDGRVFFTSSLALTPEAVTGREAVTHESNGEVGHKVEGENVYEYREGDVYLISPGDEAVPLQVEAPRLLGTDESGEDTFLFTADALVPQDTDTQASWYAARTGGGFPAPVSPVVCSGDACQGPPAATPSAPIAASATQTAGENLAPVSPTAGNPKPKALTRAQKLGLALKACAKKSRKKRAACVKQARRRYGSEAKARAGKRAKRSAGGRI
jgi:hypothetical protein